jgi:hypothetical protein
MRVMFLLDWLLQQVQVQKLDQLQRLQRLEPEPLHWKQPFSCRRYW